jgi:hypothetical protein
LSIVRRYNKTFLTNTDFFKYERPRPINLFFKTTSSEFILFSFSEYENSDIFGPLNKKGRPLKFMLLSARGFCGGFGTLLICESYKLLPIGDVKACAQTGNVSIFEVPSRRNVKLKPVFSLVRIPTKMTFC